MRFSYTLLCLLFAACGDDVSNDAGTQSDVPGRDATLQDVGPEDAAMDTPDDSAADAPIADAGADVPEPLDAGPPANPLEGAGPVEALIGDFEGEAFGFTEGPHWFDGELFFTDQYFGRPELTAVYALTPPSELRIVVQPSDGANGLAHTPSGELIACHQAGRRVAQIADGSIDTVYERYEGQRYNAPNDLVFRGDGAWFFTDPGYGADDAAEMDVRGLYFVPAGALGSETRRVWSGGLDQRPNGVALSPDDSVLYLADTADGVVRAFDVALGGELTNERTFVSVNGPDGMTVDTGGNVYVSTRAGIEVFAPDGMRWGALELTDTTNVTFGGDARQTLFITTRNTVYRTRLNAVGIEGR
ncbi:MAG: SMP-30/gluconolactonase/LRE family protein [Polyangiales bacterium]